MRRHNQENITAAVAPVERGLPRSLAAPVGVALFALLTAVGAQIKIPLPFTPVPVTLQVFFVLLSGLLMGPYYGTAAQALYIALGAAGMPMFTAAGPGFAHLLGPTGGYILGFVVAQPVVGAISRLGRHHASQTHRYIHAALALAAGIAVIYTAGVIHLSAVMGIGLAKAFYAGAMPFILTDIAKACVAFATASAITRRFGPVD